jgi:fructokinase
MVDVIALGELLIDFVPTVSGVSLIEAPAFKKAPGGAPANVAAGLAKLGISSGFMGKVGDDAFGHFLAQTLQEAGVDTSALCFSTEARTALAFVSLRADGEREFMFYRHPSADMLYTPDEVNANAERIRNAKILHYGSISLIGEPSRSATLHAVEIARQAGLLLSYDPNLRLSLWPNAEAAKAGMLLGWPLAHLIKVSEEELAFLAGSEDLEAAARKLWHPALRLLVITRGRAGCRYVTPGFSGHVPGFAVQAVDTTGAGDGFVAGLLKGLVDHPQADRNEAQLRAICRYANAVGAITTTERGAIPALPTASQVDEFLRHGAVTPAGS